MKDIRVQSIIERIVCNCHREGVNYVICGDLNVNMLKSNCLTDIMNVHGCRNIVTKSTCFKSKVATLIYVVFFKVFKRLQHITCIDCDLSDFHHMVCFAIKMYALIIKKRHIIYRSYKHFIEQTYIQDLSYIPFQVCEIFDRVDDAYWFSQSSIRQVLDDHAPLKKRTVRNNQIPYMNCQLRKANLT